MSAGSSKIQELVQDQWVSALKKVLASMTPEAFEITLTERGTLDAPDGLDESWSWYSQALSLSSESTIWAGAANEDWTALGSPLLTTAGLDEIGPAEIQSICTDIFTKSNEFLAQELTEKFASDISCGGALPSEHRIVKATEGRRSSAFR